MLSRSLIQYYRVFFFLSCCLSNNAHILAAVALQVFCRSQYPVPVVKGNKNKGSISHRIPQEQSCGLSRTKINISYLLDHIASSFGAVSENSFPYCFLRNMGVSADPLQKSRMLGNDCRHWVLHSCRNQMILWPQLVLPRARTSGATSAHFQHGKRRIQRETSAAACWQHFCNVPSMQPAKNLSLGDVCRGLVTFSVVFMDSFFSYVFMVSGKRCCYELLCRVWEEGKELVFFL